MKFSKETWIVIAVLALFVGFFAYKIITSPKLPEPAAADTNLIVREDSIMTGRREAKVTMAEFGDYQCPACAGVAPVIKAVYELYKDNPDFNFVFRDFPLPQHKNAVISSEAARAAGAQGKYWEMHYMLYENQRSWSESVNPEKIFAEYAETLELDADKFKKDLDDHVFRDAVLADKKDGTALGVSRTPTIYINGVDITDVSVSGLKAKIDPLLNE